MRNALVCNLAAFSQADTGRRVVSPFDFIAIPDADTGRRMTSGLNFTLAGLFSITSRLRS
jgi:hypothetical protein